MNSNNPKLAIIIPYYKINFFSETLKSIENQTNKGFNLYVGNDASPDSPMHLLEENLKFTKYQYFDFKDNLGGKNLAAQWERILDKTQNEEWFVILGDDDVLAENFVEIFYKHLPNITKNQSKVIKVKQCWIDENSEFLTPYSENPTLMNPYAPYNNRSSLSEHIFAKESYLKYKFKKFPLAWKSDNLAILEFSEGMPVYGINDSYVHVRISEFNISGKDEDDPRKEDARIQFEKYIIQNYYDKLQVDYLKNLIKKQIDYKYKINRKLEISLLSLYWYLKDYRKILTLPKILVQLKLRSWLK